MALPKGFTLVEPKAEAPKGKLPEGFTLVEPKAETPQGKLPEGFTLAEPSAWYERAADILPAIGKGTTDLASMFANRIGDIEGNAMQEVSKIGKKEKAYLT